MAVDICYKNGTEKVGEAVKRLSGWLTIERALIQQILTYNIPGRYVKDLKL